MNRYARMALDHTRKHRPAAMAVIADPQAHFTALGEEIQAQVTARRDEILGTQHPGETIDEYRRRGYQALRTAEELVLAEMVFLPAEQPDDGPVGADDLILTGYYRDLDEISELT